VHSEALWWPIRETLRII